MKRTFITSLLMLVASIGAMADGVESIIVEYLDANKPDYIQALSAIGRIEFTDDKAIIRFNDNTIEEIGLTSEITTIVFAEVGDEEIDKKPSDEGNGINEVRRINVSIYPNPTADHIHIDGMSAGQTARIFSTDGRLVLQGKQTDFEIGALPKGVYLLQVGSEIVKIIKK